MLSFCSNLPTFNALTLICLMYIALCSYFQHKTELYVVSWDVFIAAMIAKPITKVPQSSITKVRIRLYETPGEAGGQGTRGVVKCCNPMYVGTDTDCTLGSERYQ